MSVKHLLHDLEISSKVPVTVRLVVFVSYTALVAGVVGMAEHALSKELAKEPLPWVVTLVALCTLSISILVLQLYERLQESRLLQRMRFRYYPSGGTSKPRVSADMYDAATRVIKRTPTDKSCEILALNSFHEPFDAVPDRGAHKKFFDALNAKLGRVAYQRLVQCEAKEQLAVSLSQEYKDHFDKVIAVRDTQHATHTHPPITRLDIVRPRFPTAFVIVKHPNGSADLIWQLNEYTGNVRDGRPVFRARGLLIVTDPDRRLIGYFEGWFNRLLTDGGERITYSHVHGTTASQESTASP